MDRSPDGWNAFTNTTSTYSIAPAHSTPMPTAFRVDHAVRSRASSAQALKNAAASHSKQFLVATKCGHRKVFGQLNLTIQTSACSYNGKRRIDDLKARRYPAYLLPLRATWCNGTLCTFATTFSIDAGSPLRVALSSGNWYCHTHSAPTYFNNCTVVQKEDTSA